MRMTLQDPSAAPETASEQRNPTDEEIRRNRKERLAAMTPKERLFWFFDYYKIPVIAIAAAIVFVVLLVRDITGNLPSAFCAELINAALWDTDEMSADFAAFAGIDLSAESCTIDADVMNLPDAAAYDQAALYSAEKLMVRIAAGEIDVLAADEALFAQYAQNGSYLDLREALSSEELAFFSPWLVEVTVEDDEDHASSAPAPLGIRLNEAPKLQDAYPDGAVAGIVANTTHPERAVQFLHFLFGE